MSRSAAPTINKGAIQDREQGPARPVTPAEREEDERKRVQRERVAAAVGFGAALMDLVAYTHLYAHTQLQQNESGLTPRISGLFPPDLVVSLPPNVHLRRTLQVLLKLEPKLLEEPEEKKLDESKPGAAFSPTGTGKTGPGGPRLEGTPSEKNAGNAGPGATFPPPETGRMGPGGPNSGGPSSGRPKPGRPSPGGPRPARPVSGESAPASPRPGGPNPGRPSPGGPSPGPNLDGSAPGGPPPGGSKRAATVPPVGSDGKRPNGSKPEEKEAGGTQQVWQRAQEIWQRAQQAKQAEEWARQVREQAEQAERRARQARQQAEEAEEAEQRARDAREQAEEAEQRARDARQRVEQAEQQQQARQRAEQAEQQAKEAEKRAEEAEQEAEERTRRAWRKAEQAEQRAKKAEQRAEEAEQRVEQLAWPPSKEFKVEDKLNLLLEGKIELLKGTQNAQGEDGSRDRESFRFASLYDAIRNWNARIVELLVGYPVVLNGFLVGKALCYTQWKIQELEERWNQENGNSAIDPWNEAFGKQRVDEIQRRVNTLITVLDSRAVAAVSTGLDYWRDALLYLTSAEDAPVDRPARIASAIGRRSRPAKPPTPKVRTIEIPRRAHDKLLMSLENQIDDWLAVLTEQRPPESFPVPGIVASLTKKAVANKAAKLFRFLIPVVFAVLILGGLTVATLVVLGAWDNLIENLPAILGSLGTVLIAIFGAIFAPRGQSSFGRGGASNARGGIGGGMRGGGGLRGGYGVGAAIGNMATSLKEDVFSNVVEQLRLEELNLAINEPLVRCVLCLEGQETGDPEKDAKRFLQLVYKDQSNLKRLQPAFTDLFKY